MTEENHCYEYVMAERVNGILRDEFYLDQTITSAVQYSPNVGQEVKL